MLNPLNDKAMKRRMLLVSAMILLLGSQAQMYAQHKGGPVHKRPGMEMHEGRRPGKPMNGKAISQADVVRVQNFYWQRYRIKLSRRDAERILIEDARSKRPNHHVWNTPAPPPRRK